MSVYNPGLGQGTHPVLTLSFLRFLYTLDESLSLHPQPWLRMAQIHAQPELYEEHKVRIDESPDLFLIYVSIFSFHM